MVWPNRLWCRVLILISQNSPIVLEGGSSSMLCVYLYFPNRFYQTIQQSKRDVHTLQFKNHIGLILRGWNPKSLLWIPWHGIPHIVTSNQCCKKKVRRYHWPFTRAKLSKASGRWYSNNEVETMAQSSNICRICYSHKYR